MKRPWDEYFPLESRPLCVAEFMCYVVSHLSNPKQQQQQHSFIFTESWSSTNPNVISKCLFGLANAIKAQFRCQNPYIPLMELVKSETLQYSFALKPCFFLLFTCKAMNSFSPLQSYSTFMAIVIVTNPILWSWGSRSAARTRQRGVPQPEISICSSDPLHNCFGGAQNLIATSQRTVFFF